ncbi:hypothetical protein PENPOL_c001G02047 [Penicillium polonicum]|uniref:non-specific serine/threonine protein kinase n=1 Tax=Penicillium polonicum TaxID=60169 RepID=A0A1V6P3V8_PENPO|nr:hypothetical protein PENPOL_c001G02047 [Penicillium polonicum]
MEFNTDPNFDINDFKHDPLLFTEEGIDRYCPGGFHPVSIGDKFNGGQYTVHHKLGFGKSATVWLATDDIYVAPLSPQHTRQLSSIPRIRWGGVRWVALKILAAHIKEPKELRNLRYLRDQSKNRPIVYNIVGLLDNFLIEGPNGTHHCLVLECVGPSFELIEQSIDFNNYGHFLSYGKTESDNSADYLEMNQFPLRVLIQGVLTTVQYMHSLGLCHGGISTSNIAWGSTLPRYASREKLDETLGSLQAVSLERHDGMPLGKGLPRQILQSAKWPTYFDSGIRGHFYLIGFGKSFLRGEEPDKLKQPFRLRCPETIMGEKLDYRLDLWHTGCLIYQIITGKPLLPSSLDDYQYIRNMIGFVEDLPIEWESKLEELRLISEQNSALEKRPSAATEIAQKEASDSADAVASAKEGPGAEESPAKDSTSSKVPCLKDMAANDNKLSSFLGLLDGLLRFRPSDRLTLHTGPKESRSVLSRWLLTFPLVPYTAKGEQELDEKIRRAINEIQGIPEQPQPGAPEGALDLPEIHDQQQPAQDIITNSPGRHDDQPQDLSDPRSLQSPRQVQPETPAGASEQLVNHELQQPQVSEVCQSTDKSQSDTQIETLDLEVSDIPESSVQSELETTEDAAASSEDSQQQEPGSRKRLRSRLGGLLNQGWKPWKKRRNS